jgi:hypothetical protein
MGDSLAGAWLRFRRADTHISEAQNLIRDYGKTCKNHIVADNDSNPGLPVFILNAPDLPPILSVIVGDAIHNFRTALDYIIFELARKDSGKIQNGTQFLIENEKIDPKNLRAGLTHAVANV